MDGCYYFVLNNRKILQYVLDCVYKLSFLVLASF